MSQIAFFGAAGGLAKNLSTVAARAGFKGSIVATQSVDDFAAAARAANGALAGPAVAAQEYEVAQALNLHSRVFRSFGAARIPKQRDLYSEAAYTLIFPAGVATLAAGKQELSLSEKVNLSDQKVHADALRTAIAPTVDLTVAFGKKAGNLAAVSLSKVEEAAQAVFLKELRAKATAAGVPISALYTPSLLVNAAALTPEAVATVSLGIIPNLQTTVRALTGLVGGDGLAAFGWHGDVTVRHTSFDVQDSESANFFGAAIALCELLAGSDAATADRLYSALQKAAKEGCTYTAAAEGKLVDRVSAAL